MIEQQAQSMDIYAIQVTAFVAMADHKVELVLQIPCPL